MESDSMCFEESRKVWTNKETLQLLSIFPEEIWLKILREINDPTDLAHLHSASPLFRHLLPKRVEFLFPQVLSIVTAQKTICNQTILFPNKSFRKVCSSWRKGVDLYFQSHHLSPRPQVSKLPWQNGDEKWRFRTSFREDRERRTGEFLRHFALTHGSSEPTSNPFIGRAVRFEDNRQSFFTMNQICHVTNFYKGITNILKKYGQHIWYCDIFLENKFPNVVQYYQSLREWLDLMPNLKGLQILYFRRNGSVDGGWIELIDKLKEYKSCTPEELLELEVEIALNPFPVLKNLAHVTASGLPPPIFNALSQGNCNTDISSFSMKYCSSAEIEILKDSCFNWKLTKLDLDHVTNLPDVFVEWTQLFKMIESKWASTLTEVSFRLPVPTEETGEKYSSFFKDYTSLRLNLPHVKCLHLTLRNWLPLDFVLPMKESLKELFVTIEVNILDGKLPRQEIRELRKLQKVQFSGYYWHTTKIFGSNIWKEFKKLETLRVVVIASHYDNPNSQYFDPKPRVSRSDFRYTRQQVLLWESKAK